MKNINIMGIDLAGKHGNPSGICFLNKNKPSFLTIFSDEEIMDYVFKNKPSLILIDAPLSLPQGRCCLSNKCSCSQNGGHFRAAEVEMRKYGRTLPLTFRGMRMLTERGIELKDKLNKDYKVIESHPRTIQKIWGIKKAEDFQKYFKLDSFTSQHEFDAALLVLCGVFYIKCKYMEFGNPDEGVIILPKKD